MVSEVTVVYGIRDRDPSRLESSISSLRVAAKNSPFDVIVVNYGSNEIVSQELKELAKRLDFKLVESHSRGLPWNRGHALNTGVRKARTKYVITTDIDMIFEGDLIARSFSLMADQTAIHCRPYWLDKSGNKKKAKLGNFNQLGGYQMIEKHAFEDLGGFDEDIKYWGQEDFQWNYTLKANGYQIKWLEESDVKMYHVWHPVSYGYDDARPISSAIDSWNVAFKTNWFETTPKTYGINLELKDRPILAYIKNNEPKRIEIGNYLNESIYFLKEFEKEKFLFFEFGSRFRRKTRIVKFLMQFLLFKKFLLSMGVDVFLVKNKNFDMFYASLPFLKKKGLKDYFILDDFSGVYLLMM